MATGVPQVLYPLGEIDPNEAVPVRLVEYESPGLCWLVEPLGWIPFTAHFPDATFEHGWLWLGDSLIAALAVTIHRHGPPRPGRGHVVRVSITALRWMPWLGFYRSLGKVRGRR